MKGIAHDVLAGLSAERRHGGTVSNVTRRGRFDCRRHGQYESIQQHSYSSSFVSWVIRKKSDKRTKPSHFLGGRVGCSPQRDSAENEGRINEFNRKISICHRELRNRTWNCLTCHISTSHISLSVVNRVECTFSKWCGSGGVGWGKGRNS